MTWIEEEILSKVQSCREDLGLLQKELAEKAGVSPSTVRRAERGIPISRFFAKKIARALDRTISDLEIVVTNPEHTENL